MLLNDLLNALDMGNEVKNVTRVGISPDTNISNSDFYIYFNNENSARKFTIRAGIDEDVIFQDPELEDYAIQVAGWELKKLNKDLSLNFTLEEFSDDLKKFRPADKDNESNLNLTLPENLSSQAQQSSLTNEVVDTSGSEKPKVDDVYNYNPWEALRGVLRGGVSIPDVIKFLNFPPTTTKPTKMLPAEKNKYLQAAVINALGLKPYQNVEVKWSSSPGLTIIISDEETKMASVEDNITTYLKTPTPLGPDKVMASVNHDKITVQNAYADSHRQISIKIPDENAQTVFWLKIFDSLQKKIEADKAANPHKYGQKSQSPSASASISESNSNNDSEKKVTLEQFKEAYHKKYKGEFFKNPWSTMKKELDKLDKHDPKKPSNIHNIEDVESYAKDHEGSRTAEVLKSLKK